MRGKAGSMVLVLAAVVLAGCFGSDPPETADGPEDETTDAGGPKVLVVDVEAMPCPNGYDNGHDDDVCLGYNGQIPGPTWVFERDEQVVVELRHRVAETLATLDVDDALADRLASARYSMHRHGLSLDACSDGIATLPGTELCDSTVGPGETVRYAFNTSFPGDWHYHDHSHTFNREAVHGPLLGAEAVHRGLWGAFLVLEQGAAADTVLDLHLLDHGVNGGLGLDGTARAGERFDLLVTALGEWDWFWDVTLTDPAGSEVGSVLVAPGVSRGIVVEGAAAGTYTWRAELAGTYESYRGPLAPAAEGERPGPKEGTIEVAATAAAPTTASPGTTSATGTATSGGQAVVSPPGAADRTYTIPFDFFTAQADGLPLLEAYAGEVLDINVVRTDALSHVFHMHGHPWEDPDSGDLIDAVPMLTGRKDTHAFRIVAGLEEGHAGDWLYHCHLNIDAHMWGILRVYEHTMEVDAGEGPDAMSVRVTDVQGRPVEGATLTVRWDPDPPGTRTAASARTGALVDADVVEVRPGTYHVRADLPADATGELAIESRHDDGRTLARLALDGAATAGGTVA